MAGAAGPSVSTHPLSGNRAPAPPVRHHRQSKTLFAQPPQHLRQRRFRRQRTVRQEPGPCRPGPVIQVQASRRSSSVRLSGRPARETSPVARGSDHRSPARPDLAASNAPFLKIHAARSADPRQESARSMVDLWHNDTIASSTQTCPRDAPRPLAYPARRRGQSGPAAARGEKDRNGTGPGPQGPHRTASRRKSAGGRTRRPRHRPRVRGSRRKLPRHPRRALRQRRQDQAGHLPVRGGRGEHGRRLRQTDRPSGRGDGDARARRLPWRDRRPRRLSGQHADAAVRRPDPASGHRPRRVPGSRLPPDVRAAGEMGHSDRLRQTHPRGRRPRGRCRHQRPARPGGDRAVGGNAEGPGAGSRPAARQGQPRLPRSRRAAENARDAGESQKAGRGRRRLLLDRARAARRCTHFCGRTTSR